MNVVDSSAWLAYFADEPTADFFSQAIEDSELLIVPSVCIYEVFKVVIREKGEDDAFLAIAAMQQGKVVDLDADLAIEAAAVGNDEKLAFADSIIYTITLKYNATLWTQDAHFSQKLRVQYTEKKKSAG
jgi:predicted nucleic acid-binding protein